LGGSSFKAIGALSYAKLGWFNWETKKYDPACALHEQMELLSLIGDIALKGGVRPTCDLILTESPTHLQKKVDPESGSVDPNLKGRSHFVPLMQSKCEMGEAQQLWLHA
jgi:uncharacterized protein